MGQDGGRFEDKSETSVRAVRYRNKRRSIEATRKSEQKRHHDRVVFRIKKGVVCRELQTSKETNGK